jgi:uncharacterized protein YjbJ (UPF0337 family)
MPDKSIDKVKGRVKEAAGALTGDRRLKNEGRADQARSSVKNAVDKIADTLSGRKANATASMPMTRLLLCMDTSGERVAAAFSPMRQRYGKRSAPADACSSSLCRCLDWAQRDARLHTREAELTDAFGTPGRSARVAWPRMELLARLVQASGVQAPLQRARHRLGTQDRRSDGNPRGRLTWLHRTS